MLKKKKNQIKWKTKQRNNLVNLEYSRIFLISLIQIFIDGGGDGGGYVEEGRSKEEVDVRIKSYV